MALASKRVETVFISNSLRRNGQSQKLPNHRCLLVTTVLFEISQAKRFKFGWFSSNGRQKRLSPEQWASPWY